MPFTLSLSICNSDYVVQPNEQIEGMVSFDLKDTIKIKSIKIIAEGVSSTKWMLSESSKGSHGRSREVSYSAKTMYLNEEELLWKPSEGHAKSSIFPGIHVFPFKFLVPPNAPPSFEGDHGSIRYNVKVIVERPWKTNRTLTKYFYVLPTKDLNKIQTANSEVHNSKSKNVGFFLFHNGKVNLQIQIPKKGYVPGETICVETNINNLSNLPIIKAECCLMQQCKFLAYRYGMGSGSTAGIEEANMSNGSDRYLSRKRDETKISTTIQKLDMAPRSQQQANIRLKIPCVCPNFDSSLIHVEYYIAVKLHVKCRFRKIVKADCPVIIGSVPLDDPNIEPRTPTFGEVTVFSQLTQRSMMSVDERITSKYVYYPKFGKSKADEVEEPPSLKDLELPPIDTLSEDLQ